MSFKTHFDWQNKCDIYKYCDSPVTEVEATGNFVKDIDSLNYTPEP